MNYINDELSNDPRNLYGASQSNSAHVSDLLSAPESKVSIIKVIRSILRENVRRNARSEGTLERSSRERLTPLRGIIPSSAKLGEL